MSGSRLSETELADSLRLLLLTAPPSASPIDAVRLEVRGGPEDKFRELYAFALTPGREEFNVVVQRLAAKVELWHGVVDAITFFGIDGGLIATLMLPSSQEALADALTSAPDLRRSDIEDDELFWEEGRWLTPYS